MPVDVPHGSLAPGAASGIHVIHHWSVANQAARDALPVADEDVGRVCRQNDTNPPTFWVLARATGGVAWIGLGGMTATQAQALSDAVSAIAALRGPEYLVAALTGELSAERVLEGAGPVSVGFGTAAKAIITVATALGGGSPAPGLMSAADKVATDTAATNIAALKALTFLLQTASVDVPNGRVLSGTSPVSVNFGTAGQAIIAVATALGGGAPAPGLMSAADKVFTDSVPTLLLGKADVALTDNPQNTASYTLTVSAPTQHTRMLLATANNLIVPPDSTVTIALNAPVLVTRYGAGVTTITAGAGVTLLPANNLRLANQYDQCTLTRVAANTWLVKGEAVT